MGDKSSRITFLAHSFPPSQGGGETLIYLLAKYLARKGWQISVVTGQIKHNLKDCQKLYERFQALRIPLFEEFSKGEVGIKFFLEEAYQTIKKTSPNLIHAFNFYPGYVGSLYAEQEKISMVFTYYNTPLKDGKVLKMFSDVNVEQALVSHLIQEIKFRSLIVVSQYFVNASLKLGVPKRLVRWCYPGPDPEFFYPRARNLNLRRELGIKDKEIFIIVPARIVPRKSLETLVKAINLLKSLPIKVIISSGKYIQPGFEDYHHKILNLIKKNKLSQKILIPKNQFNLSQLGELYSSAEFGVLSSTVEGLGLGAIEVMRCAVPVIATDTEGLREVITNKINGLLFPVGDFYTLAKHIEFLSTNYRVRQEMGTKANELVARKFNLAKFIDFHDKIYKELI